MPDLLTLEDGHLSPSQSRAYWEDGYLFPIQAIPPQEAQEMRAELEALERDWTAVDLPQPLNTYKRVNSHLVMPLAHRIGTDPRLLDVIEGVLGPNIMVYGVEFFIKEPRTDHIVSMHQDLTYWGFGAVDGMVTAWLALSPATPESGCMDFVKGSHKNPILPHEDTFAENNLLSRGQEIRVDVAEEDKVPIEIHPGQISLHHGLTIHGSGPNISDDRRIAAVIRYCTPDVALEAGEKDYAYCARGEDVQGNFHHLPAPQGLFHPDDLARYEAVRKEQARIKMAGAKGQNKMYA